MKIAVHSDLHLEFSGNNFRVKDVLQSLLNNKPDLLCLVGDNVGTADQAYTFLKACSDNVEHVLFVPGNHEYYHGDKREDYKEVIDELEGVTLLDRTFVDMFGFRIHGCTLWSRFDDTDIYRNVADYRLVHTPEESFKKSLVDENWLRQSLADSPTRNIVLTHFPPTRHCLHPGFPNSSLTEYFYNDYNYMLDPHYDVRLWLCGHTHHCYDVKIEQTRMVANCSGYYVGESAGYNVDKLIVVS